MVRELVVEGICAGYGGESVIRDVTFRVPATAMLAVTGASGAGKSTLLWTVAGAMGALDGQVSVDGERIGSHRDAIGRGIGLMPQGNALALSLTAAENLIVPLVAQGLSGAQAEQRAQESLDRVGLGDSTGHLIEELSGGQQQRVAAARLLGSEYDILLADEPTSDLDAANRALIMQLLRARAQAGAIVVVTTHDPEAAEVADGELHLDDGLAQWVRELPHPPLATTS